MIAAFVVAVGCGPSETPAEPTATPTGGAPSPAPGAEPPGSEPAGEPSAEPAAEPSAGEPTAEPSAVPACERARACCRAYVAALPSARRPLEERGCNEMDTVLEGAGESSDDVCEAAIGGWRQSLQLTGIDVPESCR